MPVITFAGENLIAQQQQAGQNLIIDKIILANIAGLDDTLVPDRGEALPIEANIKVRQPITKDGLLSSNTVVYSSVFTSTQGTYDFNWMGLYSTAHDVLVAVAYVPLQSKIATVGPVIGNVITKNFAIEFNGAAALTGINISAESWQIDYTARLISMDKIQRDMAKNIYGQATFLNDALKIKYANSKYYLTLGQAVVGGLNVILGADQVITPGGLPETVWLDVYQETTMLGVVNKFDVVFNDGSAKNDYTDGAVEHSLIRIGTINSSVSIEDLRGTVCVDLSQAFLADENVFNGVSEAITFVTANPDKYEGVSTRSFLTKSECVSGGIAFPDGSGAEYMIVPSGTGTIGTGEYINAGSKQLKRTNVGEFVAMVENTVALSELTPGPNLRMVLCTGEDTDFYNQEFSVYVHYTNSGTRQTGTAGVDIELGTTVIYDAAGNGWVRKFSDNALNPISLAIKTKPVPLQNNLALLGLDSAKGSLNKPFSVGKPINKMYYSEDISQSNYATTNLTIGTGTLNWNGITLTEILVGNFYSRIRTQLGSNTLIPGERYFVSFYAMALLPDTGDEFFWGRGLSSSGSNGHGAHLLTRRVRRHWKIVEAVADNKVDLGSDPTVTLGQGVGSDLDWLAGGPTPAYTAYVGGFQIEQIDASTKQGVAVIGDSVTAGSSGGKDLPASKQWTRYAEAALNVPFFNRAIGGQDTSAMNARWAADITPLAVNCSHAVILASVNDFNGSGIGVTQTKTNITEMVGKAIADGMIPVVGTVQARAGAYAGYEADRIEINSWVMTTFLRVIDFDTILSDMYETGLLDRAWVSSDNVHPHGEPVASRVMGLHVASLDFWDFITPSAYQARLGNINDYSNASGELFYDSIEETVLSVAGSGQGVSEDVPESRGMAVRLVGELTGNRTVYLAGLKPREWILNNQTTGAFTLTIGISDENGGVLAGTVEIPQGGVRKVYTDGSTLYEL